jgi:hypothetical protein
MKQSFMQRSYGVVVGIALGLAGGLSLTHRASAPPASETMHARVPHVPPPTPQGEAPGLPAAADEHTGALSVETGRDKTTQRHHPAMTVLRQEVALIRREVAAVQRQLHAQGRVAPVVAPARTDEPAPDQRPGLAARAAAAHARQQQMAVLEANFWHEPIDQRWSSEAAGAMQAALASDEMVQHLLLGLDCRSHTCRVELAEDDTGELAQALPLILMQLAPVLPSGTAHYVDARDGGTAMVLYLSRAVPESLRTGK